MSGPIYILDANLLLRLSSKNHPHHAIARNAVRRLHKNGVQLRTVPQAVFEFWVVTTRDANLNGLGLSAAQATPLLDALLQTYPVIPDDPALVTYWRVLIAQYGVIGKSGHDARYIAAMQAHRLTHLLTFDVGFNRYTAEGITVINPANVLAASATSQT